MYCICTNTKKTVLIGLLFFSGNGQNGHARPNGTYQQREGSSLVN